LLVCHWQVGGGSGDIDTVNPRLVICYPKPHQSYLKDKIWKKL